MGGNIIIQSRRDLGDWNIRNLQTDDNAEYHASGKRDRLLEKTQERIRGWQTTEPRTEFRIVEERHWEDGQWIPERVLS